MSTQTQSPAKPGTCSAEDVMGQLGAIYEMQLQQRDLLYKIHSALTLLLVGVAIVVLGGGGLIATMLSR